MSIAYEQVLDLSELQLQIRIIERIISIYSSEKSSIQWRKFHNGRMEGSVWSDSGIVSQSNRRDYWSSRPIKMNQSINSNRSKKIFSTLHFPDTETQSNRVKFMKVRLLLTLLKWRFMRHMPKCNVYVFDHRKYHPLLWAA